MLLSACARNPGPAVAERADPPVAADGVSVHLAWTAPVDLDLYVTVPGDETFYFGNRGSAFGRDVHCDDGGAAAGGVESVRWTTPVAGRYRVGVDFPERCDAGGEVPYRLLIDVSGVRRQVEGTARHLQRVPNVEEFTVP